MRDEKEDKNVIVDAIANKFCRNVAVVSIADDKSFPFIGLFFRRSVKQLQPFFSMFITCPSFCITRKVPTLWSRLRHPTSHQVFTFENDHGRN